MPPIILNGEGGLFYFEIIKTQRENFFDVGAVFYDDMRCWLRSANRQ